MTNTDCSLRGDSLESHLRRLSTSKRREYIMTNRHTLHEKVAEAAQSGNKLLLELLLDMFSHEDCYRILKQQCRNGKLPIHHCLNGKTDRHLEALKFLLSCVTKENRYDLITAYSSMYYNCLHMAAQHNNVEAASVIVCAVPQDMQYDLISQVAGHNRRTVLEFDLNRDFRAKILKFILDAPDKVDMPVTASAKIADDNILIAWPATLTDGDSAERVLGYCDNCHAQDRAATSKRRSSAGRSRADSKKCKDASSLLYVDTRSALKHIDKFLQFIRASESVKLLMECRNSRGQTILHIAAKDNRVDIISKIFKAIETFHDYMKWKFLTAISSSGKTALHYATEYNNMDAVKLLLLQAKERDIEFSQMEDNSKHTAADYASQHTREFLQMVETHYWHTFSKPPTVLIFYNTFTGEQHWEREFAKKEKNHVVSAFRMQGIEPHTYEGFDGCRIVQTVRHIEAKDHPVSAIIVLVMSHGGEGFIYDKNKRQLPIDDLVPAVCTQKLKGIPKVLMIQACRTRENHALPGSCNRTSINTPPDPRPPSDSHRPAANEQPAAARNRFSLDKHQRQPHLCIIYATLAGQLAFQDYYLKIFSDIISEKAGDPPDDLLSINTRVSGKLEQQASVQVSSFKRKLVLRDPLKKASLLEWLQQALSPRTRANCYSAHT